MEISVVFNLQDEEGISYSRTPFQFNAQTTIKDLSKKIISIFNVDEENQKVFHKGRQIVSLTSTLQQLDVKNDDEIVVKHSLLPQWEALIGVVKMFAQSKNSEEKKMHFELAKQHVKILIESKFFLAYADLNQRYMNIHRTLFKYYDRRPEAMQNAVKAFFEKMLIGKNLNFFFDEKTEGSRAGTICTIKYEDNIERFYLKTNHDAGRSGSPSRTELDIRELFIYRFLEQLGVGATIHFPTSAIGSKSIVYIASREIPEFKTFDEVEQAEKDYINYVHPAIEILTIFTVLSIGDCHSKNVGVDNNSSPFVIDFFLDRLGIRSLERDLRHHVRGSNQINKLVDEYSFNDRVKVGVDFLKKIEFEENIDKAIQNFTEKDIRSFDDDELHFPLNRTDDLKEYIEVVKENMKKFFTYCK